MIVFSCLKNEFMTYIKEKTISNLVYDSYKEIFSKRTKYNQIKAWANSLPFMSDIIKELPENTGITIEYGIPLTSKSIDMVISGYDINYKPIIILVELKQWSYTKLVKSVDGIVRTKINNKEKNCLHPAYQVLTYAEILKSYNEIIEKDSITVIPLVYLHNYDLNINDTLYNSKYKPYYQKVNMYGKNDTKILKEYITSLIKYGDNLNVINKIDHSPLKPTKKFLNEIINITKGKKIFNLLDEQKIILENIIVLAHNSFTNNKKHTIIVKGGPGTGKSILALNLLSELLSNGLIGAYVSKNMAPRNVYQNMLTTEINEISIYSLFKSSSNFFKDKLNKYDFLVIDEAHRLQEKSGIHNNMGENQIKEIINASRINIFFIDELQRITVKDIGTIKEIEYYAKMANSTISKFELTSEFRCNGSNNYLDFIEALLYNKKTLPKFNFDFQVIDTPEELKKLITSKNTNNNARLVAGFCWPRKLYTADNQDYHDIKIGTFSASWNLKHGMPFAIRENAINEIGCVYNVQGLEFDYIGVIIGPDLIYQNKKILTDYNARANTEKSLYGLKTKIKEDIENKEYYENIADTLIRNTYRILLTRGLKGCYVYACDKNLQEYLKKVQNHKIVNI